MKKLVFVLVLLLGTAGFSFAQQAEKDAILLDGTIYQFVPGEEIGAGWSYEKRYIAEDSKVITIFSYVGKNNHLFLTFANGKLIEGVKGFYKNDKAKPTAFLKPEQVLSEFKNLVVTLKK